jgi:hypothetical protein
MPYLDAEQTIQLFQYMSPFPHSTKVIRLLLKPFERSNGRWMSLAPFLSVLLMALADLPGWLSALFVLSTVSGQDQSMCFCGIVTLLNGHLENEGRRSLKKIHSVHTEF